VLGGNQGIIKEKVKTDITVGTTFARMGRNGGPGPHESKRGGLVTRGGEYVAPLRKKGGEEIIQIWAGPGPFQKKKWG